VTDSLREPLKEEIARRLAFFTVQRWQDERAERLTSSGEVTEEQARRTEPYYDMDKVARQMSRMALEVLRLIRWAECAHCSPDGGPPPYLVDSLPPPEWEPPKYETYSMTTGETTHE
jgi:hypothetical protein